MRLLKLLTVSLLSCTTLAASKASSKDIFQKYHAKSSGPLELDDALFEELTSAPRDYSFAVILTALDARFGCGICKEFQPEWEILAKSYNKGDKQGEGRLLFGTLDFSNGRNTFQKLMLQTAPVLYVFQPTVGPNAKLDSQPVRYDFTGSQTAEQAYAWLQRHLPDGPRPPLVRPVNYGRIVVTITTLLGLITFGTVAAPYVLPIITNRNLWAAVSLISILLFTSGHMFNHIRKVPYVAGDGRGGISYFAGGFQNQFGLETQIVAAMYGVLSFATIALALKVPRISNPKTQQTMVFVWGLVSLGMYSFLLSVFRQKNGGYPFFLPPF
ncbi:putative oligosaccharyl transferase subunit [Phaeomoniella chlamydospora]|uniref:Putative oligosaccharyl transferase subunit n=1 Tax=Phaeomoniella chlamydospora TaxID=158046 RepID=A0A0G2ELI9_PHACM|nr:putative oligosaccharyl transferase subunit [Phaeomoniella chlamydospora]